MHSAAGVTPAVDGERLSRSHLRSARRSATASFFVYGCALGTWVSRIPTIKHDLGLNVAQLGIALAGAPVGLILAMRFAPGLVARRTSAVTTRGAATAACLCMTALALAPSLLVLLALLTLFGMSLGIYDISMNTQGVAIERGYGRPIMSALHGAYSLGVLVGALGGSIAARAGLSPFVHFAVAAAALLVLNTLGTRDLLSAEADAPRRMKDHRDEAGETPGASKAARRFLLATALIAFCSFFAEGAVDDWSGVYLHEVEHAPFSIAPLGAAASGAGMTVGRLVGDCLIARYGRRSMLWRTTLLAVAGMSLAAVSPTLDLAIAGYALLGVGTATIIPIAFTLAADTPGVPPAEALSRVTTLGYAGLFGSPTVIGLLARAFGLGIALWLPVALLVLIVPVSRTLKPRYSAG